MAVRFGRVPGAKVEEHRAGDPAAARTAALVLLARREYASGELTATLTRKGYDASAVAEAVAELAGERLVDDARHAESLVRALAAKGQGPSRIRQALREAGLSEALVTEALEGGPDWHALAREVRRRKFGSGLPRGWPERARQMRFLQYRGFSNDHIASALGGTSGVPGDDS